MCALAGMFHFDPRDSVTPEELGDLARGIEPIGPDGGGEYRAHSIAMAYRAFHTTPESHLESQPRVRPGSILVWDGRLDNRNEISAALSLPREEAVPDLELVDAAYRAWGAGCFARLTGDWVIALWDRQVQRLILARDAMGVRRLFYRIDSRGVAWSTAIEPLVRTARGSLNLDHAYLAGCLYPHPALESTPFIEIRALAPSSRLTFGFGGRIERETYWSLSPHASTRYATDREYEDEFRALFRQAVERRLRADRTVLAELSGGLDSSAIVTMADTIRKDCPGPRLETLSFYDTDEPSGDERPFFHVIEQMRGHVGHHVSLTEFNRLHAADALRPLPKSLFRATPGYSAQSLCWATRMDAIYQSAGARVLLSGVGGDELLGGVQFEAPELAEYLSGGHLVLLVRKALAWSLARRKPVSSLLYAAIRFLLAARDPDSLIRTPPSRLSWLKVEPPRRDPLLGAFAPWRKLGPAQMHMESVRYALAHLMSASEPPLVGNAEKRYPFLDRDLFVFLASIPRTQLLSPGRRRDLMRRALSDLLPKEILLRRTKWFGVRNPVAVLIAGRSEIDALLQEPFLTDGTILDAAKLQQRLASVEHGAVSEALGLRSALAIEQWLRGPVSSHIHPLMSVDASGLEG